MQRIGIGFLCGVAFALATMAGLPAGSQAPSPAASDVRIPQLMPLEDEIVMALSAAPPHLRDGAGVFVLRERGFERVRESSNGFTCIVNRDHPLALKPVCYDAEGTATILPVTLRFGELLMQGVPVAEIRGAIAEGFRSGRFVSPRRPGVAYMLSGEIRNYMGSQHRVWSFPPHVMFYAPNLTDSDIGSKGDFADGLPDRV